MSNQVQLRDYQLDAIAEVRAAFKARHRRVILAIATGGGKCLGKGTLVILADGQRIPVECVAPGMLLMGPDSQPRLVLNTCTGREELFRICPTRGESWVCNRSHILSLVATGRAGGIQKGEVVNLSVDDYLRLSRSTKHVLKLYRTGFELTQREQPIPPRLLGLWIADGAKAADTFKITTNSLDSETFEYLRSFADGDYRVDIVPDNDRGTCLKATITRGKIGGAANRYLDAVRTCLIDGQVRIPDAYLRASRGQRLELLAGLLDGDGYLHHGHFEIVSEYDGLADDIAFLAQSLGFGVTRSVKTVPGYGDYARLFISGDTQLIPTLLPRRQAEVRRQKKSVLRTGFAMQSIGEGEYYGFELEGDGLFLLGDCTVTHNTTVAADIIRSASEKGRVLFLAHRQELVDQAKNRLHQFGIRPGIVMAGYTMVNRTVMVASVATLVRRLSTFAPDHFSLIIVDECHHSVAGSFQKILNHFAGAAVVGLTATPYRLDGKGLGDIYQELVAPIRIPDLIERGYLVPTRVFAPRSVDVTGVKVTAGEYNSGQLFDKFNKREVYAQVVENYLRFARATKAIVFCVNVEHSRNTVEAFNQAGISARHVDGESSAIERAQAIDDFRTGKVMVLSNVNLFTEGFDLPAIETVILNRATKSKSLYLQMVGRGLRPVPGKTACIVIDQGANIYAHGPVEADEVPTLETTKKKTTGVAPVKECPSCYRLLATSIRTCPECGHEFPPPAAESKVVEFEEVRVGGLIAGTRKAQPMPDHLKGRPLWSLSEDELREVARFRNYKSGWVDHQMAMRAPAPQAQPKPISLPLAV